MGIFFTSLRHFIPQFFTVILSNVFIISSKLLILRSIYQFCNIKKSIKNDILLISFFTLLYVFFTYYHENITIRIILQSAFIAFISLKIFLSSLKDIKKVLKTVYFPFTISSMLMSFFHFMRILYYVLKYKTEADFMTSDIINSFIIIIHFTLLFLIHISYILLNSYRVFIELNESRKEIIKLQQLLPICSHCHKIRDDKGYWENLENFLEKNSDIQFSHGLCPNCVEKYYSEYTNDKTDSGTKVKKDKKLKNEANSNNNSFIKPEQ